LAGPGGDTGPPPAPQPLTASGELEEEAGEGGGDGGTPSGDGSGDGSDEDFVPCKAAQGHWQGQGKKRSRKAPGLGRAGAASTDAPGPTAEEDYEWKPPPPTCTLCGKYDHPNDCFRSVRAVHVYWAKVMELEVSLPPEEQTKQTKKLATHTGLADKSVPQCTTLPSSNSPTHWHRSTLLPLQCGGMSLGACP
jgi:hypothetical protein